MAKGFPTFIRLTEVFCVMTFLRFNNNWFVLEGFDKKSIKNKDYLHSLNFRLIWIFCWSISRGIPWKASLGCIKYSINSQNLSIWVIIKRLQILFTFWGVHASKNWCLLRTEPYLKAFPHCLHSNYFSGV